MVQEINYEQDSDVIVVGVREDNLLHCYDLSSDKLEEVSDHDCYESIRHFQK